MNPARRVVVGAVRVYQRAVSPWLGSNCRFHPTCSQYCIEAVERHGVLRGSYLALKRVLRCHPWGGHGVDPVPGSRGDDPARDEAAHKS